MMFCCAREMMPIGAAERFLHNSIQFLLNPSGESHCQGGGRNDRDKGGGLRGSDGEEEGQEIEAGTMAAGASGRSR